MRYLYAVIVSAGLCLVPSIGQAAPAADRASLSAAPVAEHARVTQSNRLERTSVGSSALASDTAADKARYAEREAQSGKASEYRGGDTVVIGTSALVVILAIVLIIVLI
jgi:hypothetical protein